MALVCVGINQGQGNCGIRTGINIRLDARVELFIPTVLGAVGCKIVNGGMRAISGAGASGAGIGDATTAVFILEYTAQSKTFRDRCVEYRGNVAHRTSMFIRLSPDDHLPTKFIGRIGGSEVQGATHGVTSEKGTLRATQDFNTLHVRDRGIRHLIRY